MASSEVFDVRIVPSTQGLELLRQGVKGTARYRVGPSNRTEAHTIATRRHVGPHTPGVAIVAIITEHLSINRGRNRGIGHDAQPSVLSVTQCNGRGLVRRYENGLCSWCQRKDEVLLDIEDVSAGHVTKQRWNPTDQWQWSREPAHQALVTMDEWQAVQDIFTAGIRTAAPTRRRSHDYMLKGMITCNTCGRKLVANVVRGRLQYRCRMKDEYPGIDHPRSLSIREDQLLPTIDGWLAQLFDGEHRDDTVNTLANVEHDELGVAEALEARRTINDCDKRIANLEIACESSDDPETITGFARRIERVRAERKGAEIRLRRVTTGRGLTEEEIRSVVNSLADAIALLADAAPEDRRRVYEAAQLEVLYDHESNRAQLSVAPRVTGGVGGGT